MVGPALFDCVVDGEAVREFTEADVEVAAQTALPQDVLTEELSDVVPVTSGSLLVAVGPAGVTLATVTGSAVGGAPGVIVDSMVIDVLGLCKDVRERLSVDVTDDDADNPKEDSG